MITQEMKGMPEASSNLPQKCGSTYVAEARARAQRAKLDTQKQERIRQIVEPNTRRKVNGKRSQKDLQTTTTIAHAIEDYLQDHEGGNHSEKTLEWHRISLGLLRAYLEQEREITLIDEIDAPAISG